MRAAVAWTPTDHAAGIVHQVVVVVPEASRSAALGGVGRIGIGGRYLFLLLHRLFHRILLFQFHQILPHHAVYLGYFFQLLTWNPTLFSRVGLHEAAVHRQV